MFSQPGGPLEGCINERQTGIADRKTTPSVDYLDVQGDEQGNASQQQEKIGPQPVHDLPHTGEKECKALREFP